MADGKTKVRFEVLMEVNMKITVTWDVTPCSLIDWHHLGSISMYFGKPAPL